LIALCRHLVGNADGKPEIAKSYEFREEVGEYLKAFRPADCEVGPVFAINGKVVGVECFSYQQTFSKFFSKQVQSYALDALDWLEDTGKARYPANL
jgi:ARG and Rhodanese-Phosphatase-superfamily-associated Protein domain